MARRKRKDGLSLRAIFMAYFGSNPQWAKEKKNDAVLAQFAADHPTIKIDKSVKQAMANAKNTVRKGGVSGTKGKRKKMAQVAKAVSSEGTMSGLEMLADHLDDCLAMARQIGKDQFADVYSAMFTARNMLIMRIYG